VLDIIKDGSLAKLLIVVILFGGIVASLVINNSLDDRLADMGFSVIGFFFGMAIQKIATHSASR